MSVYLCLCCHVYLLSSPPSVAQKLILQSSAEDNNVNVGLKAKMLQLFIVAFKIINKVLCLSHLSLLYILLVITIASTLDDLKKYVDLHQGGYITSFKLECTTLKNCVFVDGDAIH